MFSGQMLQPLWEQFNICFNKQMWGRGIFLQEVFSPCVNHLMVLFTLFSRDEI